MVLKNHRSNCQLLSADLFSGFCFSHQEWVVSWTSISKFLNYTTIACYEPRQIPNFGDRYRTVFFKLSVHSSTSLTRGSTPPRPFQAYIAVSPQIHCNPSSSFYFIAAFSLFYFTCSDGLTSSLASTTGLMQAGTSAPLHYRTCSRQVLGPPSEGSGESKGGSPEKFYRSSKMQLLIYTQHSHQIFVLDVQLHSNKNVVWGSAGAKPLTGGTDPPSSLTLEAPPAADIGYDGIYFV